MEQLKIAQQDSINRTQAASLISFGGNVGKQAVQDAATQKVAPLIPETTGDVSISATRHVSRTNWSRQWESDGRAVEADVNAGLTLENIEEKYGSGIFSNTFAIPHLVRAKSRRSREAVAFPIIRDTKAFAAIANEVNAESAGGDWTRVEDKKKKAMISLFLNSKGFTVRDYAQIDEELKTGVFKGKSLDEITDWVFNSYLAEQARYDNLAQYMRTLDTDKQRFLEENGYKDSTDFFVKNAPEEMGNNLLALQKMSPADRRVAVEIAAKMREADSLGEWATTTYQSRIAEKIGTLSPERQARIMAMVQSMNPKLSRSFGIELAGKVAESFSDTFNGLETFLEAGFVHAGAWLNDVDLEEHEWYKREQAARSAALNTVRTRYAERGAVGSILMDTGVAFADTASIMALGWATGGAGAAAGTFAWFGGGSAGNAYTDLISRGVDTKTALLSSLEVGAVEAGSEYLQAVIPLGKGVSNFVAGKGAKSMALNMLSKDYFYKVASGAATATTKKALMRGAGRAALGMAEETGTELVAVGNKALVYDALGVSVDGEFLGEVSDTVKTMPGVFLLGALTGAGAAKIRNRKNGGRMPSVTQLGAELDLAKMETAKQKAQAMRLAGQMFDLSFDAGTGTVRAHGRDGRVSEIDMDAWADMNDAERRQELEAKFFRGEKHDENDTEKAMAFFDFVQKTAEFTADNAKAATDVNAPLDKDANAEAKQAAGAIPGTVETSTGTPTPEASREALQDFVERMPIWKELGEAAPDMDISSDLSAAFGYNVEPEHPDVAEALKTLFERGDADATLAQILNEYAKSAIAQAKLGGNAKPNPLALLVEKANAFGDAGGHTGERIAVPQQGEESAGTTIPQTALDDIPNTGKYFKTLSQASGVNVRHIEALSGKEYSLSRARREVKSVLSGKKKLAQISDTGKALLRATMRFDGNARALADWISAYAAGARKGGKNTKELEDAAFEFAAGSREQRPVSEYESLRVETEAKSEAEQNLLRTVSRLNAATGGDVSVKFFDGSFFDANGFIDKDNVIHINRNAPEPLLKTFGHEFTHYLEASKGFAGLKKFILNPDGACVRVFLDRYGFSAFEDAKDKYKKLYGTQGGQNLSDEAIEREIFADVCGAVLFTRSFDALFEIRQENKNFFNRCLEFLRKLFRATRGTKIENEIANAVDRYRAVAFEQRAVLGSFSHFEQDSAKSAYNPLKSAKTVKISTDENAYSEQSATFKAIGEGQWEIPAEITAAIPALKGKVVCDKEAYKHIWDHESELSSLGYESAEQFIAETLSQITAVYDKGNGYDLVADVRQGSKNVNRVVIYLKKTESGDFYDVGTAHVIRKGYFKNKKPLWERTPNVQGVANLNSSQGTMPTTSKADVSNATQATPERNEKLLDEISARKDVGGVFMAYAKEAGLSFKFPGQYPSFRAVLELVAKKRGVPVGEVSAEALGAVAFAQKHVGVSKTETTTTAKIKPNEFEALTPSAENAVRIKGHYRVVDLSELTFVDVSDKTQQDEQERNRSGKRTEEQVQRMLMNFESERLGDDRHTDRGAPIYREVDGGLRSVSGEGRSRLLKKVYELGGVPEAQYREHVVKFARERGIEIPESVKQPVLLRVATDTGGLTWAQLAKASNTDMKSVYSTAEEAHADARELPKILNLLSGRSDEGILDERNNAFIMAFNEAIGAGTQYTQDRKSGFKETIGLRIENALVAYVINDREAATDLFDSPYSLGKTLASLRDYAVDLVRLKDNEQYDIAPELAAALKAALHVREQKERGNKQTSEQILELYFEQNTFDFEKNAREGIDLGAAKMLANLMLEKRTSRLGYVLFGYIGEVERANGIDGNDIGLFGTQDWGTKSELMQKALDKLDGNAGDVRYSLSNNSGYRQRDDGTWASYRAVKAESEGTFGKTRFCDAYGITKKEFDVLLDFGLIQETEWHHTGANFKETSFYTWSDSMRADGYAIYEESGIVSAPNDSLAGRIRENPKAFKKLVSEFRRAKFENTVKPKFHFGDFEYYLNNAFSRERNAGNEDKYLTKEEVAQKAREHEAISRKHEELSSFSRRELHKEVDEKYGAIASGRFAEKNGDRLRKQYDERTKAFREKNAQIDAEESATKEFRGKEKIALEILKFFEGVADYDLPSADKILSGVKSDSKQSAGKRVEKEMFAVAEPLKKRIFARIEKLSETIGELEKAEQTPKTKEKLIKLRRERFALKSEQDLLVQNIFGRFYVDLGNAAGIRYSLGFSRGNAEAQRIEAEAKANGTWLKAPNGKPSKLTPRQWVQVRTEAFKKWFGDWERLAKFTLKSEKMRDADVHGALSVVARKDIENAQTGIKAQLNSTQRTKILSKKAKEKTVSNGFTIAQHNYVASKVVELYENAVLLGEFEDNDGDVNVKSMFRFFAPFILDGQNVYALLTVKNTDGNKLYSVELDEIKKLDGKVERLESESKRISSSSFGGSIEEVQNYVNTFFDASKVIDENGEPLVVYHQTGNEFWAFDTSIQTHSRGDSGTPIGIFVKPDDKDIGFAGKKQMALFAKVANVKRFKNREDVSAFARRNANYVEAVKQIAENDKKFSREIEEVGKQIDEVYSKWWKAGRKTNIRENAEFNALQKKSSSILDKWKSENDKFGSEARSLLTQDLKAQGYDGIFIEQDAGSFGRNTETYVVFENAGVKSATDNAGTFDASNPDIRWSLSQPSLPGMEAAGFDLFDKVVPAEEKPVLEELKNQKKKRVAFDAFRRKEGERKSLQDVQNTFGLISLKIGKRDGKPWTTTEEIYDALLDLAEIADIPPAAIGLGGRLALEFTGRKATTKGGGYKPFKKYITAYQRGVVAHEWMHALDHYFGGLFGDRARKNNYNGTDIRPEVLEAFDNLNKTIKDSKFKVRSREFAFSREGNCYWTQPRELLARAFEVYAFVKSAYSDEALKLAEEAETIAKEYKFKSKTGELDIRSEEAKAIRARWKEIYDKAQQTTPLLASGKNFRELQVYPTPEELERDGIVSAFDKLFETLEWEQQGRNVRLYSLSVREQEAWDDVLDRYEAGTLPQRGLNTVLPRTPVVLIAGGADDLPIRISKKILDKITKDKHGIPVSELRKLLINIDDPIAVFKSRTKADALVVLTEIKDAANQQNAVVALHLNSAEDRSGHEINAIASIYGRPAWQIENFMKERLAVYANQKKSRAFCRSNRLQLPAEATKRGNSSLLTEEDFTEHELGIVKVNPETRFSLSMMNENESFEEWASRIPKLEPRKKRSADKARLHDINARSRRMIQDFIREHNELYSDPKQVRKLKVLGVALAKVLLERKLQSASEPILDAICKDAPAILRNDIKARGEMLARLMRENLDNAQAVQATIEDIAAMSNRVGRMRAYARLASMMNFGSAEAYDAIDALTRERKAKLAFAQARDVDKAKLEQIGVTKRLNAIGLSADLSQDAEDKRRRMDDMLTEAENDESDGDDAGTASGATEDADEGGEKAPAPGTQKDALKQLQDTPKAVAHELVQLVLDTIFGEGKVQAARMATDLKKIGATDEQIAGLVKTLRKTGTKALMDAMHEAVPVESRSRIGVVIGKIATEDNPARIRKLLENGFNLVALSSTRATRAQAYQKINRLLKPFARMKSRESNLNRRVDGERELYLHACYKAWTQYHSMKQAADRMEEIEKLLNALGENTEPTENDFALRKVLERELHALSLVGGARVKSVIDLLQVAWELEHGIETDKEAHEKRVEEVRERNAEAYGEIANAVRARKAVPDRKQGALEQLFTGVESFRQRLEGLIRFAGGATEAVARERIEQMDKDLANAAYRKESMAYMRVHALRDALEKIFGKDIASELKRWHKHDEALSVFSYDMKTPLTLAQVANIYAQVRQEHYAAPLKTKSIKERKSFRFKQEDIELIERRISQIPAMEAALGEKGVAVVDALCGLLRDIQPELRAAFKGVTGYEFFTEENYFPIQRHDKSKGDKSKGARRRGLGLKGINLSALPLRFSTRVVSAVDIAEDSSIFDVFDDASGASEHFIAYSQAHLFWQQAFSDPEFSDVIRKHHGKAVLNDFREHVTTILAPEQLDSGDFKAVNKLTSFAAISALGGNTLVMLRQMTGAPAFMFNMKSMDFAGYVTTALSPDGLKAVREICRENSWFKTRFGRALNDDLFAMTRGDGAFTATKARALAWYMITNNLGDAVPILFVGQGIFRATYEACLNKGMNEAQAKEVAHAEVARHAEASQQSNRVMNMSVFNRKNSSIARAVQQFKSTTQQFLSYEVRAISDVMARPTDAARWRRLGKVVLLNHIILPGAYSATTMLFDLLIGGDTDEWSDEWFSKFIVPMLLGPASGIFFVGDALTTIGGGLSRGLPAAEIISKGRRLWRAGTAMIDEDTDKALDETFKFFMDNCPPLRHAYELYENRVED